AFGREGPRDRATKREWGRRAARFARSRSQSGQRGRARASPGARWRVATGLIGRLFPSRLPGRGGAYSSAAQMATSPNAFECSSRVAPAQAAEEVVQVGSQSADDK